MSVSSVDVDVTEEESSELASSSGTSETSTQEVGPRLWDLELALRYRPAVQLRLSLNRFALWQLSPDVNVPPVYVCGFRIIIVTICLSVF